MAVYPYIA